MRYDEIRCEFWLEGRWVDLNPYRLQSYPIRGSFGIQGNNPLDRVASTGTVKLTLLNTNNLFTPGHANCMHGFQSGMKFRLRITYSGRLVTRFYGFIPPDGINIKTSRYVSTTEILAVDYMEHLAAHELDLPAFAMDKKIGEVVALILANMPVKPLSVSYGTGKTTFGSVFDTVKDKTRALQEIGKVTLAELGYVYLKQSADSDEILTVEPRLARNGKALAQVQVPDTSASPNRRITESGDVRVTEGVKSSEITVDGAGTTAVNGTYLEDGVKNGKTRYRMTNSFGIYFLVWVSSGTPAWYISTRGGDADIFAEIVATARYYSTDDVITPDLCTTWVLGNTGINPVPTVTKQVLELPDTRILQTAIVTTDVIISDDFLEVDIQHAHNYYNRVNAKAYPRRVDTSNVVLFSLENPLRIDGNTTVEVRGSYKDPEQLAQSVAAYSNVAPVATTDYVMNSAEDGSGTNMTADLTVTATHGAAGVDYELRNTSATTGYVILLQARGKGVYSYRPVERIQEDASLIASEGVKALTLDMRYQDGIHEANDFAVAMLAKYKQKLTVPNSVKIHANRECTPMLACAFATLQVGDKIRLEVTSAGYEADAFVQGMDFEITAGDVVTYTLYLKDVLYDTDEAWILEDATYGVLGSTTVLGF